MKASQNVYLNGDRTKAVAEGDKDARFLLVREGSEIDEAVAEKYDGAIDLIGKAPKKSSAPADEAHASAKKRAAKKSK